MKTVITKKTYDMMFKAAYIKITAYISVPLFRNYMSDSGVEIH